MDKKYWNPAEKHLWMSILFSSCLILYAARMTMPITAASISKHYDWSKTDSGTVLSSFFWGYMMTQVLGGYVSDHIGGERVLLIVAIGWSVLTFFTPEMISSTSGNIWLVVLGRTIIGALQGAHFPAIASIISNNLHSSEKTFFTSVVTSGPAVGMLLSGSIGSFILEKYGWPYVFRTFGLLGISWIIMLKYLGMELNHKTDGTTEAEKFDSKLMSNIPWLLFFKHSAFWSMLFAHLSEANSFFILLNWLPTYFDETFPHGKGWVFNVVPWMISPLSSILGGWLAEYLIAKGWKIIVIRKVLEASSQISKACLLVIIGYLQSYTWALICLALAVAAGGLHGSAVFMNPQDIAPQYAGSVFGIMNTVGAIPGFVGVYLAGYILETSESWSTVFNLTALLNVLGCLSFVIFGIAKPIVPELEDKILHT